MVETPVDDLLAEVLRKEFGKAFAPAEMPEVVFAHPTAVPEKAGPTVSLYLYEIRENTALRQDPFLVNRKPDGKLATKGRSPLRFDLTYAVSGHADDPRAEHALLTFALGAFLRNPMVDMPKAEGQEEAEKLVVAIAQPEHDGPQALPLVQGYRPTPSVTLRVTAPFNPFDVETVPLVRQAIFGYGQGSTPGFLGHPIDVRATSLSAAGVVTTQGGGPLRDVLVSVADRLTRTTTDEEGRYILLNLPPGKYELVFEKRGYATVRHAYEVPRDRPRPRVERAGRGDGAPRPRRRDPRRPRPEKRVLPPAPNRPLRAPKRRGPPALPRPVPRVVRPRLPGQPIDGDRLAGRLRVQPSPLRRRPDRRDPRPRDGSRSEDQTVEKAGEKEAEAKPKPQASLRKHVTIRS